MATVETFLRELVAIALWIFIIGTICFLFLAFIVWWKVYGKQRGLSITQVVIDISPALMTAFGALMLCGSDESLASRLMLYTGVVGFCVLGSLVGKWLREKRLSLFLLARREH